MPDERQPASQRSKQEVLEQSGALAEAFVLGLRLGFIGKDDRGSVFDEIEATLIARASVWLLVVASRALKGEGRVATRAKFGVFGRLDGAFRAFHMFRF